MRNDGRASDQLRPIKITRRFTEVPAGSVLWKQGKTVVLCTASVTPELPPWFSEKRPGGWITADYVMLPASTPQRNACQNDDLRGFPPLSGVTFVCGFSPSPGTPGEGWGGGALPRRQLEEPPPLPSPGVPGEGGGRGPGPQISVTPPLSIDALGRRYSGGYW